MKSKTVKKKLIILGGEGVGEIAANIALENNICSEIFFLNDSQKKYIGRFKRKFKVIGRLNKVKELLKNDKFIFFNAIINYKKKIDRSSYLIKEAKKKQISLIHPSVKFFKDACKFEDNILLSQNVCISTGSLLRSNTFVMSNSFIGHNSTIGKNCFLSANSCIGGNVEINDNCFIGLNSSIVEFCKMKKFSLLGAHSLLLSSTNVGETWAGVPAKKIK